MKDPKLRFHETVEARQRQMDEVWRRDSGPKWEQWIVTLLAFLFVAAASAKLATMLAR